MNTKISLITPTLNQAQYLEATIHSVLEQKYPNLEYLIMDGGSTDSTLDIIKKHKSQITYWESKKDSGQAHAINKGLKMATGDIIGWLNSDDLLYPGALEKVGRHFAQHPDVHFVHGHCIHFDQQRGDWLQPDQFKSNSDVDPYQLKLDYLAGFPYAQPACFFRRRILDQIGLLDEDYFFTLDYNLFIRIALNYRMQRLDEILAKFRVHADSKTANYSHIQQKERNRAFSKLVRTIVEWEGMPAKLQNRKLENLKPQKLWAGAEGAGLDSPSGVWGASRDYIQILKTFQLYHEGTDTFPTINCQYSKEEFRDVIAQFLWLKAQQHHKRLEIKQSRPILEFLNNFAPDFLERYDTQKLYCKNRFLNRPVMKLLRSVRGLFKTN